MADFKTDAVVRVGEGRGFIIDGVGERLIVTAAHCLPHFPPCFSDSRPTERAYPMLLGPIGEEPTACADCRFVDPIADLAILGAVDHADLAAGFEALTDELPAFPIAEVPGHPTDDPLRQRHATGWMLSLKGDWFKCEVRSIREGPLHVENAVQRIRGGMSGSPILTDDGAAMGLICISGEREGGPNPRLVQNLPGWAMAVKRAKDRALAAFAKLDEYE